MCLLPVKVNDPRPKPKPASAAPRFVLNTHKNVAHPIAVLPPHVRIANQQKEVPAIFLTSPTPVFDHDTDIHGWTISSRDREPMQVFGDVHWHPVPPAPAHKKKDGNWDDDKGGRERERERRRSSVLRDIEFITRVSEGIGCLGGGKEKATAEATPMEVLEGMQVLQQDVHVLKENLVKREREEELGKAKAAGLKEGEERMRWELEKVKREQELKLEAARRGREERKGSAGHHGNEGAARMYWHFHTHANVGGDGHDGSRRGGGRDEKLDDYGHGGSGSGGYERVGFERERRRSSVVSLRGVLDRIIRRDVEAVVERELHRERREVGRRRRFG